ncbi:heme-binding protein 2 [Plakobranchus ocellatus]|uniref:Heme-binding protein 2 n=1 Tax=Plakobranchus ocellatus TaxID=259542 RepID=A0AAV3YSI2_9GAST|nr:heme-binding protein 2 [Plakobranchus ocellatus]
MAGNGVIVLSVLAASLVLVNCQSKPEFCKSYDCPLFTSQSFNGYELRSYGPTTWVGTSRLASSSDSAVNGMFMKLFRYIGGDNAAGQKIKMTVPVLTKVEAVGGGQFRYTMLFYLTDNTPPAPTESGVEIITMPAKDVYVRTFYKWFFMADNNDYMNEADELRLSLDGNGASYAANSYYQTGYTSPWWPLRKHHEVWLDSV